MNGHHDLERRIADFYASDAELRAPDKVLADALATIETTSQRRVLVRVPWRFPTMTNNVRLAIAAVAVIAVAGIALAIIRPPGGPGGDTTPVPSPSPSIEPTPTSNPTSPPLSEAFVSDIHGISLSYPAGWVVVPATEPWGTQPWGFEDPSADVIHDAALTDHLFLNLKSQPVGGTEPAAWVAETATASECTATEPITIDGVEGGICVEDTSAFVVSGSRGYLILLYTSGDEAWLGSVYDRTWFEELLATVQFQPEDAVDASPSPS